MLPMCFNGQQPSIVIKENAAAAQRLASGSSKIEVMLQLSCLHLLTYTFWQCTANFALS